MPEDCQREWSRVKRDLTRGEKLLREGDSSRALNIAEQALLDFETWGWPDWWSRAERLQLDARMARMREM